MQQESELSPSDSRLDQQTVGDLLRRLILRVEESERRYGEALGELRGRLDRLSQTAEVATSAQSQEEAETLERLRSQVSRLAKSLEHVHDSGSELERLGNPLDSLADAASGLSPTGLFTPKPAREAPSETRRFPHTGAQAPDLAMPPPASSLPSEDADFDRRLLEMAERLERSLGATKPGPAVESLSRRVDDFVARFEQGFKQLPRLEQLKQLERQLTDIAQRLQRAEEQLARINAIESELQRLMQRVDANSAQMEKAVRLLSDASTGSQRTGERLDKLQNDLTAMDERSRATDERLASTLVALHDVLTELVREVERGRDTPVRGHSVETSAPGGLRKRRDAEEGIAPVEHDRTRPESHRPEPSAATEMVDAQHPDADFGEPMPFQSTAGLVAAARRAAHATGNRMPSPGDSYGALHADGGSESGRSKRSLLMVVAAFLLLVSAALFYSRLVLKPSLETAPPEIERQAPAARAVPPDAFPYFGEPAVPEADTTEEPSRAPEPPAELGDFEVPAESSPAIEPALAGSRRLTPESGLGRAPEALAPWSVSVTRAD